MALRFFFSPLVRLRWLINYISYGGIIHGFFFRWGQRRYILKWTLLRRAFWNSSLCMVSKGLWSELLRTNIIQSKRHDILNLFYCIIIFDINSYMCIPCFDYPRQQSYLDFTPPFVVQVFCSWDWASWILTHLTSFFQF